MPHWQLVRAYLHALDCQDMLVKQAVASGGSAKDVKSKHVLAALREYYIKKSIRYKNVGDCVQVRQIERACYYFHSHRPLISLVPER